VALVVQVALAAAAAAAAEELAYKELVLTALAVQPHKAAQQVQVVLTDHLMLQVAMVATLAVAAAQKRMILDEQAARAAAEPLGLYGARAGPSRRPIRQMYRVVINYTAKYVDSYKKIL
jgi:hypothetical protein